MIETHTINAESPSTFKTSELQHLKEEILDSLESLELRLMDSLWTIERALEVELDSISRLDNQIDLIARRLNLRLEGYTDSNSSLQTEARSRSKLTT